MAFFGSPTSLRDTSSRAVEARARLPTFFLDMRLALFARLSRLPRESESWMLERLAARRYSGIDVPLDDEQLKLQEGAARLLEHDLRMVVRVSTAPPSGSDAPAAHIDALERGLETVASLGEAVAHVIVQVQPSSPWQRDDALEYLRGALPLGAALLERHPHVGESTRETDAFGGRPVHLHGVSHACRSADWGTALPTSEAADVFPILRLSLDPRSAPAFGRFAEHENVDHMTLRPSAAALAASPSYWTAVRRVMDVKAKRGAPEALASVPRQVALQEPRAAGLAEGRLFEQLLLRTRSGTGMGASPRVHSQ